MTPIDQLTQDALLLHVDVRARLAQTLLASLEPEEAGAEEAWQKETAIRLARVMNGTATGRPADDVFGEIRARYRS